LYSFKKEGKMKEIMLLALGLSVTLFGCASLEAVKLVCTRESQQLLMPPGQRGYSDEILKSAMEKRYMACMRHHVGADYKE
jgi:hypothetical protein